MEVFTFDVMLCPLLLRLFFLEKFRFIEKLRGRHRDLPYTRHICIYIFNIFHRVVLKIDQPTLTHQITQSQQLTLLILLVVYIL